jgi:carnitine-CoA ligase
VSLNIEQIPFLHPFVGQDLISLLQSRASQYPDSPFLFWAPRDAPDSRYTYEQFAEASQRVATGLATAGVTVGSKVMVMLENCPEFLLTVFGCAWLGATAVTINTQSVADEVNYMATHSESMLIVTQPSFVEIMLTACPHVRIVSTEHNAGNDALVPAGVTSFQELLAQTPWTTKLFANPALDVLVQYTSGTTARPKGVVWTHANALWAAQVNARHTGLRSNDVYLVHLPLFHTNALGYSILGALWAGASVVLLPKFSASQFWATSLKYECTVTSMIPFCWKAIEPQPVPVDHTYRTWGSPICDPPFDAHFRVKSVGWWGMTETISHGIVGDPEHPNVAMSCGRPAAEYEIRILDDHGKPISIGETGTLQIRGMRGVSLFSRYLNDETSTTAAFTDDGFFITGDRVSLLDDGHIKFADRDKDMMKVAGENVSASEIERVIMSVPGVLEVAVVAKPDPMRNEVPIAFVIASPGDRHGIVELINEHCVARLSPFKVPKEVVIVDELPRAALNKVAKAQLRSRLLAETVT